LSESCLKVVCIYTDILRYIEYCRRIVEKIELEN
jgi:hypothetical protein